MIRHLKMNMVAGYVALAGLTVAANPNGFQRHQSVRVVTETNYIPARNVSETVESPAVPAKGKKMRHPLQMLSSISNSGLASWYGSVLHGHKTASGETFDKDALTACHQTLPFGTMVRVVDVSSGKSVVVRINDRGVLSANRIIDLSSAAANELGILRAGVAKVRLEILQKVERKVEKPVALEEAQVQPEAAEAPTL